LKAIDALIDALPYGATVTIDSAPIIYLLEDHPLHADMFAPVFEAIESGRLRAVISPITLAEVLAGPLSQGNEILADRYYQTLTASAHWRSLPMDSAVAMLTARIRARYGLKLPDAAQVATAVHSGSAALLTHDRDFRNVTEIPIMDGR